MTFIDGVVTAQYEHAKEAIRETVRLLLRVQQGRRQDKKVFQEGPPATKSSNKIFFLKKGLIVEVL